MNLGSFVDGAGLAAAAVGALVFYGVHELKDREPDHGDAFKLIIACCATPSTVRLAIAAGFGDLTLLPPTWRGYLMAAALIGTGVAARTVSKTLRRVLAKDAPANAAEPEEAAPAS